ICQIEFGLACAKLSLVQMGDLTTRRVSSTITAFKTELDCLIILRMKLKASLVAILGLLALCVCGCMPSRKGAAGADATKPAPSSVAQTPAAPPSTPLSPPLPAPASQDEKMAWFREAKYGFFFFLGVFFLSPAE